MDMMETWTAVDTPNRIYVHYFRKGVCSIRVLRELPCIENPNPTPTYWRKRVPTALRAGVLAV